MRQVGVAVSVSVQVLLISVALSSYVALAQSPLINGANHPGVLQIGGLDTWTIQANVNDSLTISIGKVLGGSPDPNFFPHIRLIGPDGASLGAAGDQFTSNSAEIDVSAPSTGTYTVLVTSSTCCVQSGPGSYVLTVAKTPGPYSVSSGDEGGPIINSSSHPGVIQVGDLDPWTIQANFNDNITVRIGKVTGAGPDPIFFPHIRLRGPDGAFLGAAGDQFTSNSAEINVRAPSTGTYTVLVTSSTCCVQSGPGSYVLTVSGLTAPPIGFSVAGILAVVGSTQGNGAFFRTAVQIYNPRSNSISGKFVFHTQGVPGGANDPSLTYTLNAGQTLNYPDLLPAMGISSGLGSLDIMTTGDPVPIMAARVFSDAGDNGTAGFFIEPLVPGAALQAGDSGVIIAPSDPVKARLNLGIRSLDAGASFQITVRNKNGIVRGSTTKTYSANFFEQVAANTYVGLTLDGSDTISFSINSGKAIIYGAQTDNKTQDPSVLYAKKTF